VPATCAAKLDRLTDASTLVLFDIDGTLVLTGGAGARAMARAFDQLYAVHDAFAGIPMAGRTDSWILSDTMRAHGLAHNAKETARFREAYLPLLLEELEKPHPRKEVMPGVRALLDALAPRGDIYLALLTGNFEPAARAKLEYFDLWRYFRCGAFGDDAPDRNGLLPRAWATVAASAGPICEPHRTIVIGDTPLDVACAAAGGARSIAVATGSHDLDELRACGADAVFADFSDTDRVLHTIANLNADR